MLGFEENQLEELKTFMDKLVTRPLNFLSAHHTLQKPGSQALHALYPQLCDQKISGLFL